MPSVSTLALAALAASSPALADSHYMFSGYFSTGNIVALEFDDVASTLTLAYNYTLPNSAGSKWISLDVGQTHVAGSMDVPGDENVND